MTYTTKSVVVAGQGQRDFDIPFPYLDASHIQVRVAGNAATWSLVTSGRLRLDFPANAGNAVEISRHTTIDSALVQFQNGAVLTAEDLNKAVQQTLFVQQELSDLYTSSIGNTLVQIANANGVVVTDPSNIVSMIAEQALNTSALASFNARVADITANSQSILLAQTQLQNLTTTVNALGTFNGQGIQTVLQNETSQRIAGDTAITTQLNLIGAASGDGKSIILNQGTVKVSPTQTLGDYISGVASSLASNLAAIQTETQTRADAVSSLASQYTTLAARTSAAESAIVTNYNTLSTTASTQAQALSSLVSRMNAAESSIATNYTTLTGTTSTQAQSITTLTSRMSNAESNISANASAIAANTSTISANYSTLSTATSTQAQALTALTSRVTAAESSIITEANTRSSADTAMAQQFTLLGAKRADGQAWILDESKVLVDGGNTSLGTRLSGLSAAIGNVSSALATETTARVDATGALATSLTNLQTTVGNNTATISTLQQTTNGLSARYSVAVNINGHISGFLLNSSGATSTFAVVADNFQIVSMNGATALQPFSVTGGKVYIDSAVIKDGSITSAQISNVTIGTAQIADASISRLKLGDQVVDYNKIADGTVTGMQQAYNGSIMNGNGGWQTLVSFTVPMDYPGDILAMVTLKQGFTAGARNWGARIKIDGVMVFSSGGSAIADSVALSGKRSVGTGSFLVSVEWYGQDGSLYVDAGLASLISFRRYK
ncbi:DUF1983 domain-containing protein [Novosphingobium umbonatum]|uniref:DUF1983 domain-containing protein n=1 Tax=Novosphingobium umbonatum TaxID=1908524 RepID=A0A437N0R7_9SPHN|nr:phage tail fiber protein [Novosphingobium umbonatum]RVU03491.1 DUF1983 domain-containing protein [Novosphingobium umbonatum]